jgi:endonuclease III
MKKSGESMPMSKIREIIQTLMEAYPDTEQEPSTSNPFKTLIGCILSQRTRESNSERAANNLFNIASTPEEILRLERNTLEELIRPSGFYKQKARYVVETCRCLVETHDAIVPADRESLLQLPGVGPKTADVVLSHGFSYRTVPVDIHVWRVTKRLGLAPKDSDHEETKEILESIIPDEYKLLYDRTILRIGKDYCRKTDPKCIQCPLEQYCSHGTSIKLPAP